MSFKKENIKVIAALICITLLALTLWTFRSPVGRYQHIETDGEVTVFDTKTGVIYLFYTKPAAGVLKADIINNRASWTTFKLQ